jgi:RHS repeat-associated protein
LAATLALFLFALISVIAPAMAGDAPPAMALPGQFGVSATGAAGYTIPIAVPPGTAGMAPSLSLNYSSQNGDGIVGLGWALSGLPSIVRCPRTIAQDSGVHGGVNYDSDGGTGTNDRFCLDGQRLIMTIGTHYGADGTEYRTEIESFSRIIAHGSAGHGPAWFEVHMKSGQIMEFGNSVDSRVLAVGIATARAWALNKVSDLKGNYFTVTYVCSPSGSVCTDTLRTTYGEAYPLEIKYPGNTVSDPYNYVRFSYESRPDNATPQYQAGSLIQARKRLTNIKTYTGNTSVVLDYRLAYDTMDMANHPTWRSRLASVTLCDGAGTPACLPATSLTWQGSRDTISATTSTISGIPAGPVFGDFNGDGRTDIIGGVTLTGAEGCPDPITGSVTRLLSNGDGTFASSNIAVDYGCNLGGPSWSSLGGTSLLGAPDVDGDGISDLYLQQEQFPAGGGPEVLIPYQLANFGSGTFHETDYSVQSIIPWPRPYFHIDTNGDGKEDFIYVTSSATTYPGDFDGDGCTDWLMVDSSSATISYSCNPAVSSITVTSQIGTSSSGDQITVGDFNGDGIDDILVTRASAAGSLYFSTGAALAAGLTPPPSGWGSYIVVAGDWNADGKDDVALVNASGSSQSIYLSTGAAFQTAGTSFTTSGSAAPQAVDLDNDGAPELLLNSTQVKLVTLVPEKIATIANGIGVTTTITYDRLNHGTIYTKEATETYPMMDVTGALYVVSAVAMSDGIGGTYGWTYAYVGAKWNHEGRGYAGFHQMVVTDTETNIVRTTTYLQAYPYIGLVQEDKSVLGSVTLSKRVINYGAHNGTGTQRFVYPVSTIETATDPGTTGGPYAMPKRITLFNSYDYSYGLVGQVVVCTKMKVLPTDPDPSDTCDANPANWDATYAGVTQTDNTYNTADTTHWIIGRLTAQTTTAEIPGASTARNVTFGYDLGGSAPSGLLTWQKIEPGNCAYALETDYGYDGFGNRISALVKNATGCATTITSRTTTMEYDASANYHGQFLTKVINALSQNETWLYNVNFGTPSSHTGPNILTTTWTYDTFGRRTLETRADGNKTQIEYLYCSGVNGGTTTCTPAHSAFVVKVTPLASDGVTVNGAIAWTYYDALGRVLARDVKGFDGTVIRVATEYDSAGRVSRVSRPYFVTGSPLWNTNAYDTVSRVSTLTGADAIVTKYIYQGLTTKVTADYSTGSGHKNQTTTAIHNGYDQIVEVDDSSTGKTYYEYDPFGAMAQYTDAGDHITTFVYDIRGRKTSATNPDLGTWSYVYDVLDELTSQTDAKSQVTTLTYDVLGRPLSEAIGTVTRSWHYDAATKGIGQLDTATCSLCLTGGYSRTMTYDSYGRPLTATINVAGTNYAFTTAYNTDGRIFTVTDPNNFIEKRLYNSRGYLTTLKDGGTTLWSAGTMNAAFQLTQETRGAVVVSNSYDDATGRLTGVDAGVGGGTGVANYDFAYDNLGNLTSRIDHKQSNFTESFSYDALNRMTAYQITGYAAVGVTYSKGGNVLTRSDLGTLAYGQGNDGPQEVTTCTGCTINGAVNPLFDYDANGSMTDMKVSGGSHVWDITWTTFNMVSSIVSGTARADFAYGTEHQKIRMQTFVTPSTLVDTTVFLDDPISGVHMEVYMPVGGATKWQHFLFAYGRPVGVRTYIASPATFSYFVTDHLGSVSIVTDAAGGVLERLSYDAWGRRRCAAPSGPSSGYGSDYSCAGPSASQTDMGFTAHDMLDLLGMIDMRARVYSPILGRFLSADTIVPEIFNSQSMNRYSYAENNPLSRVDPSGHVDEKTVGEKKLVVWIDPGPNSIHGAIENWHDWHPSLDGFGGGIGVAVSYSYGGSGDSNKSAIAPTFAGLDLGAICQAAAQIGAQVYIGVSPIPGTDGTFLHAFILVVGPDGETYYIRAGPEPGSTGGSLSATVDAAMNSIGGPAGVAPGFGDLTVSFGEDARRTDAPSAISYTNMGTTNMSFDRAVATLTNFGRQVNASHFAYDPISLNSNSFAYSALDVLGLSRPWAPPSLPGGNLEIPYNPYGAGGGI